MKVLVTGHNGYIGSVMVPMLRAAGHEVVGLDLFLFDSCTFGEDAPAVKALTKDLRDVEVSDLEGFDAVIHLAALSNDPLGNLNGDCTLQVNHMASVRLARMAKLAGVPRYLYASSCSLYGISHTDSVLKEDAPFNPITPYGVSKVRTEEDVAQLADTNFSPVFFRNATAYGLSPRLRLDVVVNNLVAVASATGEVLIQSDGTPWRPLVHIEDISRAFIAALHAPREATHNQAFNVGRTEENYRVSELADMVREIVPGSRIRYAEGGGPDPRSYRVDCGKIAGVLPEFQPQWTVRRGMEQLYQAFKKYQLTRQDIDRYLRIKHIMRLQRDGSLTGELRWSTHAQPWLQRSSGAQAPTT
jgi:nucleoside-diphosphate-sugar epimerase